jgi:hypothetical protein
MVPQSDSEMINETWGLGEPPCYMGQIVHPSIMWMHRQLWMRASIKGPPLPRLFLQFDPFWP